jgi:flagellar basal body rod protein FlgG
MPLPLVQQEPDSSEVISKLPDLPLDADPIRLPPSGVPVTKPEPSRILSPRQQAARQERREVIQAELPGASEEELSIWIDQFEGVPLESIRDLIRLRQQFPVGLPQTGGKDAAVSDNTSDALSVEGNSPLHISSIPGNASQHGMDSTDFSPSSPSGEVLRTGDVIEAVSPEIRTLRAAQQVLRQNMAQAKTLGYRRRIVHLEPIDADSTDAPTASFRLSILIDPSPGTWTITDRPLDIAIQGYGWLVVRDGGQRLLTRVGHLSLLENRQLGVKRGGKSYPLDPPVTLPEDYQRILINEDGAVSIAASANGETSMTGQITLATVTDAASLKEVQTGLFTTTIESGPISIETTSPSRAGKLISGRLELSNVDTEAELERHRELDDQISLLRTAWEESLSRLNWQRAE